MASQDGSNYKWDRSQHHRLQGRKPKPPPPPSTTTKPDEAKQDAPQGKD